MFDLQNVNVEKSGKTLLDDLNIHFKPGQINAIIGANGAGKSSLLKCLLGEFKPKQGEILFESDRLTDWSLEDLSLKRAYIAQAFRPQFNLPVFEYLLLARESYQESEKLVREQLLAVCEKMQISSLLGNCISAISGGEFQLVEFARAWLQLHSEDSFQGKCLLLDEPASALDIRQTQKLYRHIQDFQKAGGSVIMIDHDINAIAQLAQNMVILKSGKVMHEGVTEDVFNKQTINECFDTNGHFYRDDASRVGVYVLQSESIGAQ